MRDTYKTSHGMQWVFDLDEWNNKQSRQGHEHKHKHKQKHIICTKISMMVKSDEEGKTQSHRGIEGKLNEFACDMYQRWMLTNTCGVYATQVQIYTHRIHHKCDAYPRNLWKHFLNFWRIMLFGAFFEFRFNDHIATTL